MALTNETVAVVTGGSRGIGFAVADLLVRRGGRVCITARDPEVLAKAVAALGAPDRVLAVAGRVDDEEHQDEVVARVMAEFGRIDHLVNNAAINPVFGPLLDVDQKLVAKVLAVNTLAPLNWTRKVHRAWMAGHGGSVVNIASLAARRVYAGVGLYGMSKAALVQQTRQLAYELAPAVRVNAVLPGVVRTSMSASVVSDEEAAAYPLGRFGEPEEVASAVAHLLSADSAWTTGSVLVLDGGVSLGVPL